MKDKDNQSIGEFLNLIYSFFLKKIKQEPHFKNVARVKNATVTSDEEENIDKLVEIKLFEDNNVTFPALNKTGTNLGAGDVVCILYWLDLKNSIIISKTIV